ALASAGVLDDAPDGAARAALLRSAQHRSDRSQLRSADLAHGRPAGQCDGALARAGWARRCAAERALRLLLAGYEDSAPLGHNTVTLLTEAASVRVASPITVPADQLTGGRGFPDHQPTTTFP